MRLKSLEAAESASDDAEIASALVIARRVTANVTFIDDEDVATRIAPVGRREADAPPGVIRVLYAMRSHWFRHNVDTVVDQTLAQTPFLADEVPALRASVER
jgi:hypothetical protein